MTVLAEIFEEGAPHLRRAHIGRLLRSHESAIEIGPQGRTDMIGGKAPGMQKTALLGLLAPGTGAVRRQNGVARTLRASAAQSAARRECGADQLRGDPSSLQITADPRRPLAAPAAVADELAGVALIIEQALLAQVQDGCGDFIGWKAALAQLAAQFSAGVVACAPAATTAVA